MNNVSTLSSNQQERGSLCVRYEDLELVGGDWTTAALLSWFRRCQHKHPSGFMVTLQTVNDRLMLSRFQFERARGVLCQLGLLEIERVGFPAKIHYRLTEKALNTGCEKLANSSMSVSQHVRNSQPVNDVTESASDTQEMTPLQDARNSQPVTPPVCQETSNQYSLLSDIEKKKESQKSADADAPSSFLTASKSSSTTKKQLQQIIDAYNALRSQLYQVGLTPTRENRLRTLVKQRGFDAVLELITKGTQEVAQDRFWVENNYGFDNLIRDRHIDAKASAWDSRLTNITPQVGDWWKVKIIGNEGKPSEHPAYVRKMKDGQFECAVLLREDIHTYEEGQRFSAIHMLTPDAFSVRYAAEPACVQRVKADPEYQRALEAKQRTHHAVA